MGAYVELDSLIALQFKANGFTLKHNQPVHSLLFGRRASHVRGRGLDFEELRSYVAGDDVRSIDWRVTARMRKPYVRVYSEERDRPTMLVVDQRINMFFGSRRAMKSVTAAEAAMLCAWRILGSGDRVGGFVIGDDGIGEIKPHRSRNAVIALADRIAEKNRGLNAAYAGAPVSGRLDEVLGHVAALAHHDHLIVLITDFDGHGAATRELLLQLASSNDVICLLVYDPFLIDLPKAGDIVVSGGGMQAELSFSRRAMRSGVQNYATQRGDELLSWQRQLGLPMLPVSAAEETAPQLRRLLEQAAWRQRRR